MLSSSAFASPTRPTTAAATTTATTPTMTAIVGNPYVDTASYYARSSPPAGLAAGTATALVSPSTPPLGREVRYRPTLTYTPVLTSARVRLADRKPRETLSEPDMDDLNCMLQQLCLSGKEQDDEDEEQVEPPAEQGAEADDMDENDQAVANTIHNNNSVKNHSTARHRHRSSTTRRHHTWTTGQERNDLLLGRVPFCVVDTKTHQVTSVWRSSRLAKNQQNHPTTAKQPSQAVLGRVPQRVIDPKTNKSTMGLRSSRLANL